LLTAANLSSFVGGTTGAILLVLPFRITAAAICFAVSFGLHIAFGGRTSSVVPTDDKRGSGEADAADVESLPQTMRFSGGVAQRVFRLRFVFDVVRLEAAKCSLSVSASSLDSRVGRVCSLRRRKRHQESAELQY
jgi:hypothetical protein